MSYPHRNTNMLPPDHQSYHHLPTSRPSAARDVPDHHTKGDFDSGRSRMESASESEPPPMDPGNLQRIRHRVGPRHITSETTELYTHGRGHPELDQGAQNAPEGGDDFAGQRA